MAIVAKRTIMSLFSDIDIYSHQVRIVLAEKGVSQTELAKLVSKNSQTISRICNNTHQPTIKLLREIALVLNVNVQELLVPTPVSEDKDN